MVPYYTWSLMLQCWIWRQYCTAFNWTLGQNNSPNLLRHSIVRSIFHSTSINEAWQIPISLQCYEPSTEKVLISNYSTYCLTWWIFYFILFVAGKQHSSSSGTYYISCNLVGTRVENTLPVDIKAVLTKEIMKHFILYSWMNITTYIIPIIKGQNLVHEHRKSLTLWN